MIKIEVSTTVYEQKQGVSARTGKPYSIRVQEAWAYLADRDGKPLPYPSGIRITLGDGEAPYEPGMYQLHPSSIYVGDFSQLNIRARLRPLAAPAVSKAA